MKPCLGVVIPTLNEEARLGERLRELCAVPQVAAVVIADGGSEDRTRLVFNDLKSVDHAGKLRWLSAPRGRASQMNAGAAFIAHECEVLLFLHADVQLPGCFAQLILDALADPDVVAGAFRTWTIDDREDRAVWAPLLHLADVRSRYTRLPYGDQALFVRKTVFERFGGFPQQELMEDLELSRRLSRVGRIVILRECVKVSGRRFLQRPVLYTLIVNVFPLLYRIGVSPALLAKLYKAVR